MKKSNATLQGLKKEEKDNKKILMSLFILVIMILSVGGFALMSGGGTTPNNNPSEYPLQQVEYEGQTFWYAIRNSEQFIFENIDGYDQDLTSIGLSNKIKSQEFIEIYVDPKFTNSDSLFLTEKALKGIKIPYTKTETFKCEANTLIFTTNQSQTGDCIKFISTNEEAYTKANILIYHLVKQ